METIATLWEKHFMQGQGASFDPRLMAALKTSFITGGNAVLHLLQSDARRAMDEHADVTAAVGASLVRLSAELSHLLAERQVLATRMGIVAKPATH